MQVGPHRPFSDRHRLRDLVVPVPLHLVEHKDGARVGREARNRRLEVEPIALVDSHHASHGRRFVILVQPRFLVRLTAPLPPLTLQHHVHRQPVKPGAECRLAAKARELLPRAHEDVVRELPRALPVAGHAQAQSEDPTGRRPIQRLECLRLPLTSTRHQRRLVGGVRVARVGEGHPHEG